MQVKLPFPTQSFKETMPDLYKICSIVAHRAQAPLSTVFYSVLSYLNHPVQMRFKASYSKAHIMSTSMLVMTIVDSGERKDTVDKCFNKAQRNFQNDLIAKYHLEVEREKNNRLAYEHALRTKTDSAYLPKPINILNPIVVTGGATKEGIVKSMNLGYPFHSIFSTEGAGFLTGYANNKENSLATLSALCTLKQGEFSADAKVSDLGQEKIDRGELRFGLENIAFNMYLSMQPLVLARFLNGGEAEEQGFTGRCHMNKPESLAGKRFTSDIFIPNHELEAAIENFFNKCSSLYNPLYIEEGNPKSGLKFSSVSVKKEDEPYFCRFLDHFEPYTTKNNAFCSIAPFLKRRVENTLAPAVTLQMYRDQNSKFIDTDILKFAVEIFQHSASESNTAILEAKSTTQKKRISHKVTKFLAYLNKGLIKNSNFVEGPFNIKASLFRGIARAITVPYIKEMVEQLLKLQILRRVDNNLFEFTGINIENNIVIIDPEYHDISFPYFNDKNPKDDDQGDDDPSDKPIDIVISETEAVALVEKTPIDRTNTTFILPSKEENEAHKQKLKDSIDCNQYIRPFLRSMKKEGSNVCCPFHDDKTPSLYIDRSSFNCFAGCGGGDIFNLIAKCNNLDIKTDFSKIVKIAESYAGLDSLEQEKISYIHEDMTDEERIASLGRFELELERQKEEEKEKLKKVIQRYCKTVPLEYVNYYHERCGTSEEKRPLKKILSKRIRSNSNHYYDSNTSIPAIVASFINLKGEITGIHQTYLADDLLHKSSHDSPKKMYGFIKGNYISVIEPQNTEKENLTLLIAEGIETTISAWFVLKCTNQTDAVSSGSGGNMKELIIPSKYSHVIIAADNGDKGKEFAELAKIAYEAQRKIVEIHYPPERFNDFNDFDLFLNLNSS